MHGFLAQLFQPVSLEAFLRETLGRQTLHLPGNPDRFKELLDWHSINQLLATQRYTYPRLRLASGGTDVAIEEYTREVEGTGGPSYRIIDTAKLNQRLTSGAMLVIDSVDESHAPLRELAENFEALLRERVKINAYAIWSEIPGFDTHWDDHDIVILQLQGSKRWHLYGQSRPWPMRRDIDPNLQPPARSPEKILLQQGDLLHVPRGCWHTVSAEDTPSLHLTVGITQRTGIDLLTWLTERLHMEGLFRQDIPRYADRETLALYLTSLADVVGEKLRSLSNLTEYFDQSDALAMTRPRLSLPHVSREGLIDLSHDQVVSWIYPRTVLRTNSDRTIDVLANGARWMFTEAAEPVLRAIVKQSPLRIYALIEMLALEVESATVRSIVADLCLQGLVSITSGHSPQASFDFQEQDNNNLGK